MTDGHLDTASHGDDVGHPLPLEPPTPPVPPAPWTVPETLAVFALAFLGTLLLTYAASLVVPAAYGVAASLVAFNVALAVTTVGFVALRHPGHVGRLLGWRRPSLRDAGLGLVAGLGAYAAINVGLVLVLSAIAAALGFELPETQQGLRDGVQDPTSGPLVVASAVLLAPVAEELFFRGMLFQAATRRFRLWGAVLLSAVAFALAHAQPTGLATLVVFVAILPLGILLARLFARRGSLLTCIVVHATFNAVGAAMLVWLPDLS